MFSKYRFTGHFLFLCLFHLPPPPLIIFFILLSFIFLLIYFSPSHLLLFLTLLATVSFVHLSYSQRIFLNQQNIHGNKPFCHKLTASWPGTKISLFQKTPWFITAFKTAGLFLIQTNGFYTVSQYWSISTLKSSRMNACPANTYCSHKTLQLCRVTDFSGSLHSTKQNLCLRNQSDL